MGTFVKPLIIKNFPKNILNLGTPVPEGYLFKDFTLEMPGLIPTITTERHTQYLNDKYKIVEPEETNIIPHAAYAPLKRKIYLPRIRMPIVIKDINLENICDKYDEYYSKMRTLRFKFLNKLKRKIGQGVYYLFFFMCQTIDEKYSKNAMLFEEGFSAVWADKIIGTETNSLFTIH